MCVLSRIGSDYIGHAHNFIDITGNIYNYLKVLYWDVNVPIEKKGKRKS